VQANLDNGALTIRAAASRGRLRLTGAVAGVAVLRGRWREARALERARPAPSVRPARG
jgi:hypothetical protein